MYIFFRIFKITTYIFYYAFATYYIFLFTYFKCIFSLGNTPLHTAVHNGHTEIAKFLVASGADEFKRNLSGLTPFQL